MHQFCFLGHLSRCQSRHGPVFEIMKIFAVCTILSTNMRPFQEFLTDFSCFFVCLKRISNLKNSIIYDVIKDSFPVGLNKLLAIDIGKQEISIARSDTFLSAFACEDLKNNIFYLNFGFCF